MSIAQDASTAVEKWLRCKIDSGMFSDEKAVTYPAQGTPQKSVFVAKRDVRINDNRVRVIVVDKGGRLIAVLPSANRDIVFVEPMDLSDR